MDPRDDLDSLAGRVDCAACGELVPTDRIRILARRDDIAFVEIACPACRSDSLGIVVAADGRSLAYEDGTGSGEAAGLPIEPARVYGEFGPNDEERFREALPIERADLAVVSELLARGGLEALVGSSEPPSGGQGR